MTYCVHKITILKINLFITSTFDSHLFLKLVLKIEIGIHHLLPKYFKSKDLMYLY